MIVIGHVWMHSRVASPVSLILILEFVVAASLPVAVLWIIDSIALLRVRLVLLIVVLLLSLLLVLLLPVVLALSTGSSFILIFPVLRALRLVDRSLPLLALVVSFSCRRASISAAFLLIFVVLAR